MVRWQMELGWRCPGHDTSWQSLRCAQKPFSCPPAIEWIADVVTYVCRIYENTGGPMTPADVAKVQAATAHVKVLGSRKRCSDSDVVRECLTS